MSKQSRREDIFNNISYQAILINSAKKDLLYFKSPRYTKLDKEQQIEAGLKELEELFVLIRDSINTYFSDTEV